MVNVAMITPWHVRCGIATYSVDLAWALAQEGVNVYVIRLPRFGAKSSAVFESLIDTIPPQVDLIHVQHEYGLFQTLDAEFFNRLREVGKPIVTTMHATGNWEVDAKINELSDRVIVHNEFCFKHFAFTDKLEIIPHGCKLGRTLPPEEAKRELHIPVEAPIIGYLGFVSAYKGLETLIDAMVEVKEAALLVAGGTPNEQAANVYALKLKQSVLEKLPNRCQWIGYVDHNRLPIAYGAMDILVYPSRFVSESGALLMALGHGKAVIASNLPPIEEKAKEEVLVTFKDTNDLITKIRELLKDKDKRHKLEERAKQYCETHSWQDVAKKHIRLYGSLLNREPTA